MSWRTLLLSSLLLFCTIATTAAISTMLTPQLGGFVPLKGALVVTANQANNSIDLIDVDRNLTVVSVPLSNAPRSVVADPAYGAIYASLSPQTAIARVNILSGRVEYVEIGGSTQAVAVGDKYIYVVYSTSSALQTYVCVLDRVTSERVATVPVATFANSIVAYNDEYFIVGLLGYSTSVSLYRYTKSGSSWTLSQQGITAANGNSLAISPDGKHVVMAAGGGNGFGYSILDIDPRNFTTIYGSYETGAYPVGAAYSPDMRYFMSSNYDNMLLFDAARHNVVQSVPLGASSWNLRSLHVSYDGLRAYAYAAYGGTSNKGVLLWTAV